MKWPVSWKIDLLIYHIKKCFCILNIGNKNSRHVALIQLQSKSKYGNIVEHIGIVDGICNCGYFHSPGY